MTLPVKAAEIGYAKTSDTTYSVSAGTATLSPTSLSACAVASWPANSKFDLTAKLGMSNNNINGKTTGSLTLASTATPITSVIYGVGAQYHINSEFSLRTQYEDFGALDNSTPVQKMTAFSIGVAYDF